MVCFYSSIDSCRCSWLLSLQSALFNGTDWKINSTFMKWSVFFFFLSVSFRSSDRMLWWTGESIPAAGLLSLTSRQHDRRALWGAWRVRPGLRGGRPVHRQRQWQRLGRGVPAAAPPLHRPRPPAGGALHGHCGHDEASPAKSRGRAAFDAALVFLRTAADRQAALGSAQHLQGLCRAGHPQPATATRAQINTGTQSRGLQARVRRSNGLTATGAHASGKLTLPQPVGGSIIRKGGKKKKIDFLFLCTLLFSLHFCWEGLCMRRSWRSAGAKWTEWRKLLFYGFTYWNFDPFWSLFKLFQRKANQKKENL